MRAREIIDDYRDMSGSDDPDDLVLLRKLRTAVNDLLSEWPHWSWATLHLNPIAKTETGVRNYGLPSSFGAQFVRAAHADGSNFQLKISDGTSERDLSFVPSEQFFNTDFTSAQNGYPESYSLLNNLLYQPEIWLDPAPDSNSSSHYTLHGTWTRRRIRLDTAEDHLPNQLGQYLLYCLLKGEQDNPSWTEKYVMTRNGLFLEEAQRQGTRFAPRLGQRSGLNDYENFYG